MAEIQELRQKYPQYSDMSDQEFADRFHSKFYSDIPKDDFYKKIGFKSENNKIGEPNQQKSPLVFNPMSNQEEEQFRKMMQSSIREGLPGSAQGFLNSLASMGNLATGGNLKFNFAPETEAGKTGEAFGDIASYFSPRSAFKSVGAAHAISNALKNHPISSAIMKNLGSGAEAALFGAAHAPEGEKAWEGGKAGLMGSGIDLTNALLSHKMPLISRLASAGMGGLLGHMFGYPGTGALIGGLVPQLKSAILGPSKTVLAENALRDVNPQKIVKSLKANEALETIPTPGQAEGSYFIQGREGALRKQAGKLGEDLEREALDRQSKAAKKMLDDVYKPSKENEQAIDEAYKKAYDRKYDLHPDEVEAIKADPIMKDAFDNVKRNPAFKDVPENSYEFLTQVNRELWTDYKTLAKSSDSKDRITARHIKNARLGFDKYLKNENPEYKKAAQLAAPKMARQELEEVKLNLHKEQLSGKNIYKKLLDTPKKYKDAQRILKPYPKALKSLKNMREGWQEYANIKTGSQAEAQAKTRIDQARNILNWVNDFLQSNIGKRATEAQLKYIHSPEWKQGFALIKEAKNQREAVNKTLDLVSKMGLAYGLSQKEVDNLKAMMISKE